MSSEKKITLKSSDGEMFEVDETVALEWQTIKHMVEDDCADTVIPLPNVTSAILSKVIEYCKKHVEARSGNEDDLKAWDADFVKVDQNTLTDLILAANYLNIQSLLDLTTRTVADVIKGMTPEEMRETFNSKELSPEEKEKVRRENPWAFEEEEEVDMDVERTPEEKEEVRRGHPWVRREHPWAFEEEEEVDMDVELTPEEKEEVWREHPWVQREHPWVRREHPWAFEEEEEVDIDVSVVLRELTRKLEREPNESSAGFKIQKVPEHRRTENVKAYEPQIIVIGPLNHSLSREKTHLAEMQKHKVRSLKKLLRRKGGSQRDWVAAMGNLEKKVRCSYAEPIDMGRAEFMMMLVLDACFIVELFRKFELDLWEDDDNVLRESWVRKKLGRDLLLVDNQLPLFVLQKFYNITKMEKDQEINFPDLILHFFSQVLPVQLLKVPKIGSDLEFDPKITHLLGFMYDYYWNLVPRQVPPPSAENWNFIVCATNLKQAGIKFKKIEGESLLSIDFDKDAGLLKIPALTIDDDTESLFRNISVYEQFFQIDEYAPFINYLKFMDCLINTAKDVELLCKNKILHNCLGDSEVVANMFNRLGDSVALPLYNYYGGIFHNVNEYCDRRWKRWIANLWHNYFYTPWTIVTVFAALLSLILTLIRTLFLVLAYFRFCH